uniref:Uncharacterized protein n=1 Tax=Timema poppense TaxID=170557 RepID=A0A7R9DT05_TIMPO|nr:unnamed protein product [Timema poppensis]
MKISDGNVKEEEVLSLVIVSGRHSIKHRDCGSKLGITPGRTLTVECKDTLKERYNKVRERGHSYSSAPLVR